MASSTTSSSSSRRRRRRGGNISGGGGEGRSLVAEVKPLVEEQQRLAAQLAQLQERIAEAERRKSARDAARLKRKRRRTHRELVVLSQTHSQVDQSSSGGGDGDEKAAPDEQQGVEPDNAHDEKKEEDDEEQEEKEERRGPSEKKQRKDDHDDGDGGDVENEQSMAARPISFYPPATQDTMSSQSLSQATTQTPPRPRKRAASNAAMSVTPPSAPRPSAPRTTTTSVVAAAVVSRLHQRAAVRLLRLGECCGRPALLMGGDSFVAVWRAKEGKADGTSWVRSCMNENMDGGAALDAVWTSHQCVLVVFADRITWLHVDGSEAGRVSCRDEWRSFTCALVFDASLCAVGTTSGHVVWLRRTLVGTQEEQAIASVSDCKQSPHKIVCLFRVRDSLAAMQAVGTVLLIDGMDAPVRLLEPRSQSVSAVHECVSCGPSVFVEGHPAALVLLTRPKFAGVCLVDAREGARRPLEQHSLQALPQKSTVGPLSCVVGTVPPLGIAALRSGTLRVFSCLTGQRLSELNCHKGTKVTSVSALGGTLLASGDERGRVFIHNISIG